MMNEELMAADGCGNGQTVVDEVLLAHCQASRAGPLTLPSTIFPTVLASRCVRRAP